MTRALRFLCCGYCVSRSVDVHQYSYSSKRIPVILAERRGPLLKLFQIT